MKLFLFALMISQGVAFGQQYIEPIKIEVSENKTTNLVFPCNISSVDRGNESIIVRKSTENVLRVKANAPFADETNLTAITADGKLYSFLVKFNHAPDHLTLKMGEY